MKHMANISQGAPGSVDPDNSGVQLVHAESNIVNGERRSVELFSDGSRKHYVNGVLTDDVRVFSDAERDDAMARQDAEPTLTPAQVAEIDKLHNPAPVAPTAPEADTPPVEPAPVAGELTPTETFVEGDHLTAAQQATIVNQAPADVPVFAVTQPDLGQTPPTPESDSSDSSDSPEENEGAVSDTPGTDVEGNTEVSTEAQQPEQPNLDEMTVATLKDHADEKGVDLGDAKLKDEIKAKIEQWYEEAKAKVEEIEFEVKGDDHQS